LSLPSLSGIHQFFDSDNSKHKLILYTIANIPQ
jgi:hypothetical protein